MFTQNLKLLTTGSLALGILLSLGCGGGATNNDQGTSFLATGYFKRNSPTDATLAPSTGDVALLNSDVAVSNIDGLFTTAYIELQNRLSRQFIRTVRIDCKYEIPGSNIDVPDDSFQVSQVLGPAQAAAPGVATPTAPAAPGAGGGAAGGGAAGGVGALASSNRLEFLVVSPDLYSFLNSFRASLPVAPFRMIATCSATGVSQAGDVFTTNSLNYLIQFVENAECCTGTGTTPGFQNGPGTGGDLTSTTTEPATTTN